MKKKSHTDSKIFIPPSDFRKWNLQYTFIENEKFLPIKKMIDKKFEVFFKKLIYLSLHKEILKRRKEDILLLFYDIIYERIRTNPYLKNVVNRLDDMMNIKITEPIKRLLKSTNTTDTNEPNYRELHKDAVLRNFELTIDAVFAIPNIVLTSYRSSSYSLNQKVTDLLNIVSDLEAIRKQREEPRLSEKSHSLAAKKDVIQYYLNHKKSSVRNACLNIFDKYHSQYNDFESRDFQSFYVSFFSWCKLPQNQAKFTEVKKFNEEKTKRNSKRPNRK